MEPGIPWPKEKGERDVRAGSHQGQEAEVWEISKSHYVAIPKASHPCVPEASVL